MADSANLKSLLSPKAMAGGFATTRTDSAQFSIKTRLTKEASSSVQKRRQLSSARTMNRFPSSRCASPIQIVRPLELIVETQPQLQPALLRLSAMSPIESKLPHLILNAAICRCYTSNFEPVSETKLTASPAPEVLI